MSAVQSLVSTGKFYPASLLRSLRPCPNRNGLARGNALIFAIRLLLSRLAALANVDATLEEGAIFNRNAGRDYVAGKRTVASAVDPVASGKVATHFAQHYDFAGDDMRRNHASA